MSRRWWRQTNALDLPLFLFLLSAVLGLYPAYDRSLCWPTLAALAVGFLLYLFLSRAGVVDRWWRLGVVILASTGALLALYVVLRRAMLPAADWPLHPNSVATFLEGCLFPAVGLLAARRRGSDGLQWATRIVWSIAVGVMGLALLMTGSQGAWLAVGIAGLLWLALRWRPARWAAAIGGAGAVGLLLYVLARGDVAALGELPVVGRALTALFLRPDRLAVYRESLYLIGDVPLTGVGLGGQFGMAHARYALLIQHLFLRYSHNLYLEVWLQQGLLGAVALLWLLAALYQAVGARRSTGRDVFFQSTWLGLTAIFLHGLTDARQYVDVWCWLPFFWLLGLNGARLMRRRAAPAQRRWLAPGGVVGVSLLAVGLLCYPWMATWHANVGCVLQARAELAPSLDEAQRRAWLREAVVHYRRAIEVAPADRTARQRLGWILVGQRRFDEAVEQLEAARRAQPANTTTRKALGLAYVWVGRLAEAQPLLEDVPGVVQELNDWGWWWASQGLVEQALNAYRASLLLAPGQPAVERRLEQLMGDEDG